MKHSSIVLLTLFALYFSGCQEDEACLKKTWFEDSDQDGLGNPQVFLSQCDQPDGYVINNDDDSDQHNSNCENPITWYADTDEDGLGDQNESVVSCTKPDGFVSNHDDKNDSQCQQFIWFLDSDGDGLGNPEVNQVSCEKPLGFVRNVDDEDDTHGITREDQIIIYNPYKAYDGYVLLNELGSSKLRLVTKDGTTVSAWELGDNNLLGNDAELLQNGSLVSVHKLEPAPLSQGGYGGSIQIRNENKQITWQYDMSSTSGLQHHDLEVLPNGNVLVMAWEVKTPQELISVGYTGEVTTLNSEAIYEIDTGTQEIAWEWHAWDHLVQDEDETKSTFGYLFQNPEKINVNYVTDSPEFMHCNGIDHDAARDIIYISVRKYSEVWVIDHQTTSLEAIGSKGDLLYRFGNPATYKGTGDRLFTYQHHPNLIEGSVPGKGNMLVFSNNPDEGKSNVIELDIPDNFDFNVPPKVVWSYDDDELFSPILSGAERLPNGNTLISSGTQFTATEVTPDKEVVWKMTMDGKRLWRTYSYSRDYPGIWALGL
ncbi:MAG: arylsulfotransferase family protein [Marinoscillum sp.]